MANKTAYDILDNLAEEFIKLKFEMYSLCASIVGKCNHCVKSHYDILKNEGMTVQQLQAVGKIAAVINAVGKIAL